MLQGEFTFVNSNANTEGVKEFLVTFDIEKVFDVTRAKSRDENQAALRKRLWQGNCGGLSISMIFPHRQKM